jgi:hypothetical protein
VAGVLGGKRTPLSGAVGGGDISLPDDSIFADWSWEAKRRQRLPSLLMDALAQASADIGIGDPRRPAVVMREDRGPAIFICRLDDFVAWALALAEMGNGARVRELIRQMRRDLDTLERSVR